MGKKPNVMNPILIARADNSAPDDRRIRAAGSTIDEAGNPVERPDLTPEQIALEKNPNLMFEHWDEFWRKVHGPRCIYKDGEEDNFLSGIHTYCQIHRLPAAPCSAFAPPYPAMTDENGSLYQSVWDKVPEYKRPMHDGLVYWAAPSVADLLPIDTSEKALRKICPEGNLFTRNGTCGLSAEYIIIPSMTDDWAPVCTVKTHYAKEGVMSKKKLQEYLLNKHSDFIKNGEQAKKVIKRFAYIMNINEKAEEPFYSEEGTKLAAISVTFFQNMRVCEDYFASEEYAGVAAKEAEILDLDKSEWWTGLLYQIMIPETEEITDRNGKIQW